MYQRHVLQAHGLDLWMLPWNNERRRWWVASDRQLNDRQSRSHCVPFSPAEYRCTLIPQRTLSAVRRAQRISVQTIKQLQSPHVPSYWKSFCAKAGKYDGWCTGQIQDLLGGKGRIMQVRRLESEPIMGAWGIASSRVQRHRPWCGVKTPEAESLLTTFIQKTDKKLRI